MRFTKFTPGVSNGARRTSLANIPSLEHHPLRFRHRLTSVVSQVCSVSRRAEGPDPNFFSASAILVGVGKFKLPMAASLAPAAWPLIVPQRARVQPRLMPCSGDLRSLLLLTPSRGQRSDGGLRPPLQFAVGTFAPTRRAITEPMPTARVYRWSRRQALKGRCTLPHSSSMAGKRAGITTSFWREQARSGMAWSCVGRLALRNTEAVNHHHSVADGNGLKLSGFDGNRAFDRRSTRGRNNFESMVAH